MKTGMALMKPTPACSACSTYHFVASSLPTGRYETMTSTLRSLRMPTTSAVGPGAFSITWRQVLAEPVVGHAAVDGDAGVRHVG